jgi:hypothetical protein
MKYLLLAAGLVLVSLPGKSVAEFYVWRDAHGVRQISNVPRHCIRGHVILPGCLSLMAPLADPKHVSALNDKQYKALVRQQREEATRLKAEQARRAAQTETAAKAVDTAAQERDKKLLELRKQLNAAEDEAKM